MGDASRGGAWFYKSSISYIDMPFEHEVGQLADGWKITAVNAGKATLHLGGGHKQSFDLLPGDYLASTGPEMYLSYGGGNQPEV